MGSRQLAGVFLASLAAIFVVGMVRDRARRRRRRRRNPWITMRNRRRVFIDDEGRIEHGLPELYRGVHVQDLSRFSRELREIEREGRDEERRIVKRRRGRTFKHAEGVRALLEANPELVDFLEAECSHDCDAYRTWVRRGRRGPKPRWRPGDGRFDALNERLERRKSGRKIASWLEAVDATPPPSRRWEDFPERLEVLEEATGLRLNLPAAAESFAQDDDELAGVRRATDDRIEQLVELARTARLSQPGDDGIPF